MAGEISIIANRSLNIAGQFIGGSDEPTVAADFQALYRQNIANGAVDYEVDFPITVNNIAASVFHSTRDVDIYTNQHHDSTTPVPDQHIHLAAGATVVYTKNDPDSNKTLTTNVTTFYISNASGGVATVTIAVALKQAPTGDA